MFVDAVQRGLRLGCHAQIQRTVAQQRQYVMAGSRVMRETATRQAGGQHAGHFGADVAFKILDHRKAQITQGCSSQTTYFDLRFVEQTQSLFRVSQIDDPLRCQNHWATGVIQQSDAKMILKAFQMMRHSADRLAGLLCRLLHRS